jgi:alpha-N-arabinofuranosidase
MFKKAIEEKYPDIQIIASPSVFDNMTIPLPAAGDYHPYEEPDDFYHDFHQFANLTKDNLTIVGEFASVHPNGGIKWDGGLHPYPWWIGSVAEAIFMISTEIYGDRIIGSTYAPIMRNMNSWSWSACLVQFEADVRKTTLSTSYHVFKLIANSVITHTQPTTPKSNTTSLFWVAGRNDDGSRIVKLANYNTTNHEDTDVSVKFEGLSLKEATLTLLRGTKGPYGVHEDADDKAFAEEKKVLKANKAGAFNFVMPELSVAVLESGKRRPGGRD